MTFLVDYWDAEERVQKQRESTPEEDAQREIDIAAANDINISRLALIKQIDSDVDAIYFATLGNRSDEYNLAHTDALAYQASGYTGDVPQSIQSWADAKGWTPQQSTDDILTTAALWSAARDAMRSNRLARKEEAKVAADKAGLFAVEAAWAEFRTAVKAQLGIT